VNWRFGSKPRILSKQAQNALENETPGLQCREVSALLATLPQLHEQRLHAPGLGFSYLDLVETKVNRPLGLAENGEGG
jgi:hypothetical protein